LSWSHRDAASGAMPRGLLATLADFHPLCAPETVLLATFARRDPLSQIRWSVRVVQLALASILFATWCVHAYFRVCKRSPSLPTLYILGRCQHRFAIRRRSTGFRVWTLRAPPSGPLPHPARYSLSARRLTASPLAAVCQPVMHTHSALRWVSCREARPRPAFFHANVTYVVPNSGYSSGALYATYSSLTTEAMRG